MNTQATPILELPSFLSLSASDLNSTTLFTGLTLLLFAIFFILRKRIKITYRLVKLLIALNNKTKSERTIAYDLCHIGRNIITSKKFTLSNNESTLLQQLKYNKLDTSNSDKLKKLLKRVSVFSLVGIY